MTAGLLSQDWLISVTHTSLRVQGLASCLMQNVRKCPHTSKHTHIAAEVKPTLYSMCALVLVSLTLSVYGSESVSINYIPQIRPWQLCALGASVVVLVCALRCYCCQNNANVRYQLVLPSEKKCGIKWTKRKSKGGRKDRKRNVRSGWNSQVIRMKWKEWK